MAQRRYHHQPAQVLPFQPAVDGPSVLEAPQKEDSLTCRQKASLLAIFLGGRRLRAHYAYARFPGCGLCGGQLAASGRGDAFLGN